MNKIKRAMLTLLASTFVALQLGTGVVSAQTGSGLRVSPLNIDLEIERGSSADFVVQLENVSNQPVIVSSIINDFQSDGVTGEPKIIVDPNVIAPNSLRDFIQRDGEVNIESSGKYVDEVTISVPESTAPGAYYSLLRYESRPEALDSIPDSQVQFSLTASTGVIVLVEVPGEADTAAEVSKISARIAEFEETERVINEETGETEKLFVEVSPGDDQSFFSSQPNQVAINIANTGQTLVRPLGQVQIKNMLGQTSYEYELNTNELTGRRAAVLPDSSRTFTDRIDISGFGRYTIDASIAFEQGSEVTTVSSVFWVVPIWLILVTLVLLALLVYVLIRVYRAVIN